MALLSAEHLAGPGYVILNVIRGLNIVALLSVVASSVVMLVKTFIVSKFFFFDATSHVVTSLVGMFLIVSECSLFRGYFARNWPMLSPSHGFVFLGSAMMVLGLNMLGNMNKEATSQKSLGLPFWRLLVAAGILSIVIGFFNVIASFIFRDTSRHITARRVRSHGAISLTEDPADLEYQQDPKLKAFTLSSQHTGSTASRSIRTMTPPTRHATPTIDMGSPQPPYPNSPPKEPAATANPPSSNNPYAFNFSNPLNAIRSARQSFLPSYHSASSPSPTKPSFFLNTTSPAKKRTSSIYSRSTSGQTKRSFWLKRRDSDVPHVPEISGPLNVNPQFAHLVRPDLAHHPSVRRAEVPGAWDDKI